jgi:hypothetical protein
LYLRERDKEKKTTKWKTIPFISSLSLLSLLSLHELSFVQGEKGKEKEEGKTLPFLSLCAYSFLKKKYTIRKEDCIS